jgi:hypothetical protein
MLVSTNYANRDISLVVKDVQTYAKWSDGTGFGSPISKQEGLGIRGIFLDETPKDWSVGAGKYFEIVAGLIRSQGDDPLVRCPISLNLIPYLVSDGVFCHTFSLETCYTLSIKLGKRGFESKSTRARSRVEDGKDCMNTELGFLFAT